MEELTNSDYNSITYFWEERGDIERWGEWEERKSLFEIHHPELIKAMSDLKSAYKMMNLVVDSLIE